jgi:hypothetical protein
MSSDKSTLQDSFEELLNKSIEASKTFVGEGTRIVRDFAKGDKSISLGKGLQGDTLSQAFNEYVRLNVTHISKLMDLGLNFVRNISGTESAAQERQPDPNEASFSLEGDGEQGADLSFQFILDNVKQEKVVCQLVHSGLVSDKGDSAKDFRVVFTPQAFELKPGESRQVNIAVHIPQDADPTTYTGKVQVRGFEPAFFIIRINVTEKAKPTANARKGAKAK